MKEIRAFPLTDDRRVLDPAGVCVVDVVDAGRDHTGTMVWAIVDLGSSTRRPWSVWLVDTARPLPARARFVSTIVFEPSLPARRSGRTVHVFARRSRLGGSLRTALLRAMGVRA